MSVQQAETKFYDEGGVLITNARAVLGGTTYPLANITSVGIGVQSPSGAPAFVLIILGLLFFLFTGVSIQNVAGLIVMALGVGIGIMILRSNRDSYYVKLGTAGGEQRALSGRDKATVEKIVAALNEAIISRG